MTTVDALIREAFAKPRDPRSSEYRAGVRSALEYRLHGVKPCLPFRLGTAAADAFFSGQDEGHAIWRNLKNASHAKEARS